MEEREFTFTEEDVRILTNESGIRFDEEYRRGAHENWGGRPLHLYEFVYDIINGYRD